MTINDFYNLGFIEEFKDPLPQRRRVLDTDEHYQEVTEIVKQLKNWDSIKETLYIKFKYNLYSLSSQGDEVTDATCYFDDSNTERVIVKLNDIRLDVIYNKETKFVYSIYDRYRYFSPYGFHSFNEIYEVTNYIKSRLSITEFMQKLLKTRQEDAQNIKNYYNKELKNMHRSYRDRLNSCKTNIKIIKNLTDELEDIMYKD